MQGAQAGSSRKHDVISGACQALYCVDNLGLLLDVGWQLNTGVKRKERGWRKATLSKASGFRFSLLTAAIVTSPFLSQLTWLTGYEKTRWDTVAQMRSLIDKSGKWPSMTTERSLENGRASFSVGFSACDLSDNTLCFQFLPSAFDLLGRVSPSTRWKC